MSGSADGGHPTPASPYGPIAPPPPPPPPPPTAAASPEGKDRSTNDENTSMDCRPRKRSPSLTGASPHVGGQDRGGGGGGGGGKFNGK
ncbi:hypothetical protein VTH82DRAFT_1810 [Thermothelomyces myriococcoides]